MAAKPARGGDPTSEDFPSGPAIGEPVPAFTLPDQHGRAARYPPADSGKTYILFYRSASW